MNRPLRPCQARLATPLLLGLLAVSGLSCSSSEDRLYPVRGQVLYKGKPVAEAQVVFHPLEGRVGKGSKPIGFTGADGRFTLTTHRPGDGAAAGEYAVTVELREKTADGGEAPGARNLLPARYSKPESSGLHFRVQAGDNEVPVLKLTK